MSYYYYTMPDGETSTKKELLRLLPSVDALLRTESGQKLAAKAGVKQLAAMARQVVEGLRAELTDGFSAASKEELLQRAAQLLQAVWDERGRTRLQRVINATGVIVHTNLGRAPLSEAARTTILDASGYCHLEYNLARGKRGRRGARAEKLLTRLTGAESA